MKKQQKYSVLKLACLPMLITGIMNVSALEQMDDDALANVSGQDGLAITASMDDATIDKVTWKDGTAGSLVFGSVGNTETPISITSPTVGTKVATEITVQTSADSTGKPALKLGVGLGKAKITVPKLSLCDASGNNCDTFGGLSITNNGVGTKFNLITTNGLLNKDGTARLKAVIDDLTVALKQTNGGSNNSLMLGNMYANITAEGKLYVADKEGLRFIGTVDFNASSIGGKQRDGLEVLVQHKAGNGNANTLGKVAITGGFTDVDLAVRGVKGIVTHQAPDPNNIGSNIQVTEFNNGTNGIAMRMSANFKNDLKVKFGDKAGLALTGWKNIGNAKSFDTGNVYVNIMPNDANTIQHLTTNSRLALTAAEQTAADNSVTLGRGVKHELGDTSNVVTDVNTTGQQYITRNGYVVDLNGSIVRAIKGIKQTQQGLTDSTTGQHLSLRNYLKDGYATNNTFVTYLDDGDYNTNQGSNVGISNWSGDEKSQGGRFEQVEQINADGTTSLVTKRLYDSETGTGNDRGVKPIYVWRQLADGTLANGTSNVVVGSFDDERRYPLGLWIKEDKYNAWFKAVNLETGNAASKDNLAEMNNPYTVNSNGEVLNKHGVLLLRDHDFNQYGFLVKKNSGAGTPNYNTTKQGINQSNNYVYQYDYVLDDATKELVVKTKTGTVVKRIKLATYSPSSLSLTSANDYKMTNATISGDSNTANAAKQSVALNVRGLSLQGYPTKTEFFENPTSGSQLTDLQNWSIAPVIYNLDANALLFPKTLSVAKQNASNGYLKAGQSIGYKAVVSTKGSDSTDTSFKQTGARQTTGLFVTHDDATQTNKTRYIGLRHLDTLIKAQGDIQVTNEGVAVTADDFLFAFRGELATGLLPDAGQTFAEADRLVIVEGKLAGDVKAKLYAKTQPGDDRGLGVKARIDFSDEQTTGVRLMIPKAVGSKNNGSVKLANITGTIEMDATIKTVDMTPNDASSYDGALNIVGNVTINPDNTADDDLRIRNIGFSATPISGTADKFSPYKDSRIGEIALTQHNIYTDIKIRGAN